jgi:Na+/H+-dicarboxylate symporter
MKDSAAVLIALVLALVAGIAIAATGNTALLHGVDLVAPLGTLWVNAIRMTVIPLVVSLLVTGVASASELKTIGRMGGRAVFVFLSLAAGTALVAVPALRFVFGLLPHDAAHRPSLPAGALEAASQLAPAAGGQTLGAWLTSLIPPNPIAAAANGAMLPLIVFTILLALAIARSPATSRERLVGFFQALRDAMLVLVGWIVALAPIGVFALVLPLAARSGLGLAGGVGFYIVAYSIGCLAMSLLLYPVVAIVARVPIKRFAKAALPVQLIALSTSSSIASLPALIESARDELGLDDRVTGFVLPLAVSVFHIAGAVSWTSGAMFVAWFYGIDLHVAQLVTIALATVTLNFAVPGIPRGAFIMLTPLFLSIGLPAEGIGILIAVDAFPDMFSTVLNVTGDLAAAALVARGEARGPMRDFAVASASVDPTIATG